MQILAKFVTLPNGHVLILKVYKQGKQKYFPIFRLFGAMEIHGHVKTEIMLDLKSALYYAVSVQIIFIFVIFVFFQVKLGRYRKSSFYVSLIFGLILSIRNIILSLRKRKVTVTCRHVYR